MIGILLTETMELVYTLGKFGYDGSIWTYNWYYGIVPEEKCDKEIKELKERIKKLEQLVENDENSTTALN